MSLVRAVDVIRKAQPYRAVGGWMVAITLDIESFMDLKEHLAGIQVPQEVQAPKSVAAAATSAEGT